MSAITFVHGDLYDCAPDWAIEPLEVAVYCLFYVVDGRGWMDYDGTRLDMQAGDLFLSKPGERMAAGHDAKRPIDVYSVGFHRRGEWGGDAMADLPWPYRIRLTAAQRRELTAAMQSLVAGLKADDAAGKLTSEGELLRALGCVVKWSSTGNAKHVTPRPSVSVPTDSRIAAVLRHIDQHLSGDLAPSVLAGQCHWTPAHFSARFREVVGMPPTAYVRRRRIDRAKQLLASTDKTVAEIAGDVGFADPYHFSRVFRQLESVAPTTHRRSATHPWFA